MSFRRQKNIVRYYLCKHDAASKYEFCDSGDHEDTAEKNEECWTNQDKTKEERKHPSYYNHKK
jgi:hypothetical protein